MATGILSYDGILSILKDGQYICNKEAQRKLLLCVCCFGNNMFHYMGKERMGVKPRRVGLAHAGNNILI